MSHTEEPSTVIVLMDDGQKERKVKKTAVEGPKSWSGTYCIDGSEVWPPMEKSPVGHRKARGRCDDVFDVATFADD
jgi:hypothetical protein